MSITADQLRALPDFDGNVVAADGSKIGGIGQVYLDDQTGDPSWVTAKTGFFGTGQSFVPLEGASLQGRNIQVAYDEAKVKGAPRVDDDGALSPQEEDELYAYYEGTEAMYANLLRDASLVAPVESRLAPFRSFLDDAAHVLAAGWGARGGRRTLILAAARHAVDFHTWHSLARDGGVRRAGVVELASAMVGRGAGGAR